MHPRRALAAAAAALPLGLAATLVPFAAPAAAAPMTFTVTTEAASGLGSFAAAVALANANPGDDTILFAANVEQVAGSPTPITISDAVFIQGCRADGDDSPANPNWVPYVGTPGVDGLVIDAPGVTIHGLSFHGGRRPVDVTANGDEFRYRGAEVADTTATFRVTGATDVLIGGGAPAPCLVDSGDGFQSVFFRDDATYGIELVDAVDGAVRHVELVETVGPAIRVDGGTGNWVHLSFILGPSTTPSGDPTDSVVFEATGTTAAPTTFSSGQIAGCAHDCLLVTDGSHARIGFDGAFTDFHGPASGFDGAAVRILGSSADVDDIIADAGSEGGIVVGAGSHDVDIDDVNVVASRSSGIEIEGTPAPTDVAVRNSHIGVTDRDPWLGVTIAPVAMGNSGYGVLVGSGDGVTIEDNIIASNGNGDVRVDDNTNLGDAFFDDIVIRDNVIGLDRITGGGIPVDANDDPSPSYRGIAVEHAPGVEVRGNTVAGTTQDGVIVIGDSPGTIVADNDLGQAGTGLGLGQNGIFVDSPGVTIDDNQIGPAGAIGIYLEAPGAIVRRNAIGATETAMVLDHGGQVLDNVIVGNGVGIHVSGNDNLLRGNTVRQTTTPDSAVRIFGQRNTVTRAAMSDNAGFAIDLRSSGGVPANNGIHTPTLTRATVSANRLRVTGTVTGPLPAGPGRQLPTIDVYGNPDCGTNDREAARWLGQVVVSGGRFDAEVPAVTGYSRITVTVTDPLGNTSELSSCVAATSGGLPIPIIPPLG